MLVDLHNHTKMCCHARGEMEEYVMAALEKGIDIFGFSAHSPWMFQNGGPKMTLAYDEVPIYMDTVRRLQEKYSSQDDSKISILLGMEMDYLEGKLDSALQYAEKYDFDYIIGSVHHIGGWGFDQESQLSLYEKQPIRVVYEQYFELVKKLAKSGAFDIIGHLDLVKKFGYYPENGWDDIQEDVASVIAETGMVVEINTSGRDKPVKEFYPGEAFLKQLYQKGVQVTLGSDSHAPEHVGRYLHDAVQLLEDIGYTEIVFFEKRNKRLISIV